jgi:(p)ppGpp synthase/HD superfamily hydrolase
MPGSTEDHRKAQLCVLLPGPKKGNHQHHREPDPTVTDFMAALILDASEFAKEVHAGQKRKYTGEDYYVHPLQVANLLTLSGASEEVVAAGFLHDTIEDCWPQVNYDVLEGRFGTRVADLVVEVTNLARREDGNRAVRSAINRAHLAKASPEGQSIKYADLICNTASIVKHDPKFARIYLGEKTALLEVMTLGDPMLRDLAWKILDRGVGELLAIAA